MKTKLPLIKTVVLLVPAITFVTWYNLQIAQKRYEPYIYTLTGGKVLVARIPGDPDTTLDTAGITFYSAGRKLKLSPSYITARHSDRNQRLTTPEKDWIVYYSRMVPETATYLADIKDSASVSIYYERRGKTEVAEMLHFGRYENIPESLVKLQNFVKEEGYRLDGFYEEVYQVFEAIESDPDKYETILRYQITKR